MKWIPLLHVLLTTSLAAAEWAPFQPAFDRLAPKPAWEVDITERLKTPDGQSHEQVFSVEQRNARVKGLPISWKATLMRPEEAAASWPLVLEADESRIIQSLAFNGRRLPAFSRSGRGELWSSGEGWVLLPNWTGTAEIELNTVDSPHVYPNGFGRLGMRPATLDEVVSLEREGESLRIRNRSDDPVNGSVEWRAEDYFGQVLGTGAIPFNVGAQSTAGLAADSLSKGAYRVRHKISVGGATGLEYWSVSSPAQTIRSRPEAFRLEGPWQYVFSPNEFAPNAKPPENGWKPVPSIPFRPDGADYSSHWMWVRTEFQVPDDWTPGRNLAVFLPTNVHYHGRIFLDGKEIGQAANWELPRLFLTSESLKPGSRHRLALAITDYIVGLSPTAKPPASGPMQPPGRGVIAPMPTTNPLRIAFDTIPEITAVPSTSVDRTQIQTTVVPEKKLSARVFVRSKAAWSGQLRAQVLEAGTPVLNLGEVPVEVPAGGITEKELTSPWADAPLWSIQNPRLLELRVELIDQNGNVVDTFRDRFGFREFGFSGSRFTLNGQPLQLIGGSHIYVTNLLWPLRSHPYNFVRHGYNGAVIITGGTASGVAAMNAADETGYLLKTADWNVNAHIADNYDWRSEKMWERLRSTWRQAIDTYANHPSVVMWDVANEVSFRGEGEAAMMGRLFDDIRKMDPTRLVTIGGSLPLPENAEILNSHGWGSWNNRTDFYFGNPELRPPYLRTSGYFIDKPANDPEEGWTLDLRDIGTAAQNLPGGSRSLRHIGGRPILFAEGHYYESSFPFPLNGHDSVLPQSGEGWNRLHGLNILATRSLSLPNVRQGKVPGTMIHVDRGIGRMAFPLIAISRDRETRFVTGKPIETVFEIHNNLPERSKVHASFRLFAGEELVGSSTFEREMDPFSSAEVPLTFAAREKPGDLRLEVRVWPDGGTGWFADDVRFHVLLPATPTLPSGKKLAVFDPGKRITEFLGNNSVPFETVDDLALWKPASATTLLIGPDALEGATPAILADLGRKVADGAQVVVLDHASLPRFLRAKLPQSREIHSNVARMDGDSPLTSDLTSEDFRAWQTRDNDQLVSENPLDVPSYGRFRVHATTVKSAPILEVAEGKGRVLFVQMNLSGALGLDPSADRLFANILNWTGTPSPFGDLKAVVLGAKTDWIRPLVDRFGLDAVETPTSAQIASAKLILLDGSDPDARATLEQNLAAVKRQIEAGATLYIANLDSAGAEWLTKAFASPIRVSDFPHRYARIRDANSPVTSGLGHADFLTGTINDSFNEKVRVRDKGPLTGEKVVVGEAWKALTEPAYIAELPTGRGRIIVNQTLGHSSPLPSLARITSVLLANAGALLDPEGSARPKEENWSFQPLDLSKHVNRSLIDSDQPDQPRGWNASGANNDLRDFPTGRQNFRGVEYLIAKPTSTNPNSFIALNGAKPSLEGLPDKVTGIPVNAKADRLYFLHVSVWGVPEFVYRIYYKEDRAKWIPGQPDPFVDVRVIPGEHILDWVDARAVDRGERFMPGATVAWLGGTERTRTNSATGNEAVGVFQMAWDNPHPEKTIESIDILSPGERGTGHPFVLGITAASRADTAVSKIPLADVASVLPEGTRPDRVAYHERFPAYGYVLLNDGTIGAVYDRDGRRFASSRGWRMEVSAAPDGSGTKKTLLQQARQKPEITTRREPGRIVHTIVGSQELLSYTATVTATPSTLRYELEYTPGPVPENPAPKIVSAVSLTDSNTEGAMVNEQPVPINTPGGRVMFSFDRRYLTWVFSYFVHNSEVGLVSPPHKDAAMAPGSTESLWWELTMP